MREQTYVTFTTTWPSLKCENSTSSSIFLHVRISQQTVVLILPQRKFNQETPTNNVSRISRLSHRARFWVRSRTGWNCYHPSPRNITCMSCSSLSQVKEIECNSRCTYSRQFHINEFLLTLSKTILFKNAIHSTRNLTNKVARTDKGINFSRGSGKRSIFCNADFIVFVYEITRF